MVGWLVGGWVFVGCVPKKNGGGGVFFFFWGGGEGGTLTRKNPSGKKAKDQAERNFVDWYHQKKQVIQSDLFDPLVGGHLTPEKGHLTIPKRWNVVLTNR